jgi:hypothetical protein
MPFVTITLKFDETTLPPLMKSLVRAETSLAATHMVLSEMPEFEEAARDFDDAVAGVTQAQALLNDAIARAVLESDDGIGIDLPDD